MYEMVVHLRRLGGVHHSEGVGHCLHKRDRRDEGPKELREGNAAVAEKAHDRAICQAHRSVDSVVAHGHSYCRLQKMG